MPNRPAPQDLDTARKLYASLLGVYQGTGQQVGTASVSALALSRLTSVRPLTSMYSFGTAPTELFAAGTELGQFALEAAIPVTAALGIFKLAIMRRENDDRFFGSHTGFRKGLDELQNLPFIKNSKNKMLVQGIQAAKLHFDRRIGPSFMHAAMKVISILDGEKKCGNKDAARALEILYARESEANQPPAQAAPPADKNQKGKQSPADEKSDQVAEKKPKAPQPPGPKA